MSYDNTNRGAAWKNDKRENEKQPAYKGSVNVEGVEYFISFWGRKPDAKPNSPDFSFQLTKKEDVLNQVKNKFDSFSQPVPVQQAPPPSGGFQDDDDIPFL